MGNLVTVRVGSGGSARARGPRPARPKRPEPQAYVAFEKLERVAAAPYCPRCGGLLFRQVDTGVLCALCGRLWVVRELLTRLGVAT